MEARLKELLERMTASGPFPQISASEGHELVDMVYEALEKEAETPNCIMCEWFAEINTTCKAQGYRAVYQDGIYYSEACKGVFKSKQRGVEGENKE